MKGSFCEIVIGMFFVTTNGQCPFNVGNKPLLSSCEGMMKHGPTVLVDFYKISRPCTCTVTPSFDDGIDGNLKVICGSPSETTVTTIVSSTPIITSPIESTSVVVKNKKTDVTKSSKTDIIVGSAAGGAIILVGLVILIIVLMKMKRSRSAENKERSSEVDRVHKIEIFDSNPELPNNLLYLSLQPLDELEINSNYDVLLINKPIDHGASSMPVYDVPKRSRDDTPEVGAGDVYVNV
uniref:Uncharacterized protein n=1 Tax=Magallana gigas TaxID=29159 RepID=A0A8W8JFT4_MAGGI